MPSLCCCSSTAQSPKFDASLASVVVIMKSEIAIGAASIIRPFISENTSYYSKSQENFATLFSNFRLRSIMPGKFSKRMEKLAALNSNLISYTDTDYLLCLMASRLSECSVTFSDAILTHTNLIRFHTAFFAQYLLLLLTTTLTYHAVNHGAVLQILQTPIHYHRDIPLPNLDPPKDAVLTFGARLELTLAQNIPLTMK